MTHREHLTWHLTNDLDCVLQEVLLGRPSHRHLRSALTLKQGEAKLNSERTLLHQLHPATGCQNRHTIATVQKLTH